MKTIDFRWYTLTAPPYEGEYIVTCKGAKRATALQYENGKWTDINGTEYEVIAWQFLPNAYIA